MSYFHLSILLLIVFLQLILALVFTQTPNLPSVCGSDNGTYRPGRKRFQKRHRDFHAPFDAIPKFSHPKDFFGKILVPHYVIDFLHSYITHWISAPYIECVCSECSIKHIFSMSIKIFMCFHMYHIYSTYSESTHRVFHMITMLGGGGGGGGS